MNNNKTRVSIGKITKHQGNKGEVRAIPLTDNPERFELLDKVLLVKGDRIISKEIEYIRFYKNFIILKLDGVDDLEQASDYRNYLIQIPEEEKLPLPEGEYYIDDLIGFKVLTEDGRELGNLTEVIKNAGTDIFLVKGESAEYMIPAARAIITKIDQTAARIMINPPPGLLEL